MNPDKQAFTIPEFCSSHGISRGLFYRLIHQGRAPRLLRIGRRVLVSAHAAKEWREAMTTDCESLGV